MQFFFKRNRSENCSVNDLKSHQEISKQTTMIILILVQFRRKFTCSGISTFKSLIRPAQVYMHFVLYGEINFEG